MTHRGVALVLVLLVLVLATTAVAGAARLAIAARAHRHVGDQARTADAIRVGAEGFAEHFLRTRAPRVVLGPDVAVPAVPVIDDTLQINGREFRVTVTAYDQCGMVPWSEARRGSPLRTALPPTVVAAWDQRPTSSGAHGLDRFRGTAQEHGLLAFPAPVDSDEAGGRALAIGALVATHNPEPSAAGRGSTLLGGGLVNVNTAPRSLLAAALRAAGATGLDEVLDARKRGQPAPAPATRVVTPGGQTTSSSVQVRLVSQSDCWSFRIDVESESVRRSWWCVYRATGSEWRCVQRVAICE